LKYVKSKTTAHYKEDETFPHLLEDSLLRSGHFSWRHKNSAPKPDIDKISMTVVSGK